MLTLIAAFIALIIFARRALIEGYYISSYDQVMSTFSTEVQKYEDHSKLYHAILEKYDKDIFGRDKALQPLQTYFLNLCFKDYMENLNWLEKFVICLYSAFTVGKFSINLELSRARRRNWFEDRINDFLNSKKASRKMSFLLPAELIKFNTFLLPLKNKILISNWFYSQKFLKKG